MTTHFRVMRALSLSMALVAAAAPIALADSPAGRQTGSPAVQQLARASSTSVVPNNGLCGAQYGVPMADCDEPHVTQHASTGAAGGVDYRGFPYNLPSGS
jgi:hypothetical protein